MPSIRSAVCRLLSSTGSILILSVSLWAQASPAGSTTPPARAGVPVDWSTSHVIYTRNGSPKDMMRVHNDPRFLHTLLMHHARQDAGQLQTSGDNLGAKSATDANARAASVSSKSKVDWAVNLGTHGGMAIGESPAKFSFNPNLPPTCTSGGTVGDFVVFSLKVVPAVGGQANLFALTNLYSGTPAGPCGSAPTVLFSYAIGTGRSFLSPVLSFAGDKVAWVETSSANHAILHVTQWVANQGTDATHSVAVNGTFTNGSCIPAGSSCDFALDYTSSAYPGCNASVSTNKHADLFVDYSSDTGFLSADNGILYHIANVFGTKGAVNPSIDFCIPVNPTAGVIMAGGVYDSVASPPEFFINDNKKVYAYQVGASSFTLVASYTYAVAGGAFLTGPSPLLDVFNNWLYLSSVRDTELPTNKTSVTQIATSLAPASATVVTLGPLSGNGYRVLYYGAFDNNYFNFGPMDSRSTLYTCGTDATRTNAQDLFALSFNPSTGALNTTPAMPANTNVNPGGLLGQCSPITEFFDGTTDRIFVGMGQHLSANGANVVTMWDVTTQLTDAATTPTATASGYVGGTSGIIIDNNASGTPQAESIYFTTEYVNTTRPGICGSLNYCAVKLTQSALQ